MSYPAVSCMCLTYGRPRVLEEAIYSFLSQEFDGPSELVVLNDFAEQELVYEHPDVNVINIKTRFKTVGEKRNACAALCKYDVLAVWDDDDIYLPWRLEYCAKMMAGKRYFKPSKAWILNNGALIGPKANLYHPSGQWTRELFDSVRGYKHMGSGQDMEIELEYEKILPAPKNYDKIKPEEIYYIYRWAGTGSYHLSAFGRDDKEKKDKRPGNVRVEEHVKAAIEAGKIESGKVSLEPQWKLDYLKLVKEKLSEPAPAK